MTTIVPTSEEDPALTVLRFVSDLAFADAGPEVAEVEFGKLCLEAQECMLMNRWLDLASLMLTSADSIFSKLSEKDIECIYTVICNLVTKTDSLDEALEMANLIVSKITQHPPNEKQPASRLKIMFNLYNLMKNPYSKFFVYMKALNLAATGKVTQHIIPSFIKIDTFLNEWNLLGTKDKRDLFLAISNILKDNKSTDSFLFLNKYLESFSGEDDNTLSDAKEEAVRAIVEFVKAPDMFQCDLLDIPAVVQLEKDDKYAAVYQLLKIFLTQRLEAYMEFHAANSTLLENYGIVHEECVTKMRLISLVDLSSNESGQVSYSLIKDALQIDDEEVELWVVKAIGGKLLDCKMDQMNKSVIVSRCSERVFGKQQWQALQSKLATWKGNVSRVINTIQANKVSEEGSIAMQGLAIR